MKKQILAPVIALFIFTATTEPLLAGNDVVEEQEKISQALDAMLDGDENARAQVSWLQAQTITSYHNQINLTQMLSLMIPDSSTDVETAAYLGLAMPGLLDRLDRSLRFFEVALTLMEFYEELQYFRMTASRGDSKLTESEINRIKPIFKKVSEKVKETIEWYLSEIRDLKVASDASRISSAQRDIIESRYQSFQTSWGIKTAAVPGQTPEVVRDLEQVEAMVEDLVETFSPAPVPAPESWTLVPTDSEELMDTLSSEAETAEAARLLRVNLRDFRQNANVSRADEAILDDPILQVKMRYLLVELIKLDPEYIRQTKMTAEQVVFHLDGIREDLTMRGESRRFALIAAELMKLWIKHLQNEARQRANASESPFDFQISAKIAAIILKMANLSLSGGSAGTLNIGAKLAAKISKYDQYRVSYNRVAVRTANVFKEVLESSELMANEPMLLAILTLARGMPVRNFGGASGILEILENIQL